jgi:cobalt-zinc-cadmium efflux system outer membrane protein
VISTLSPSRALPRDGRNTRSRFESEMEIPMRRAFPLIFAAITVAGCGASPPSKPFNQVQSIAQEQLGKQVRWNRESDDDQAAARSLRDLLSHPLSVQAAVQVALLNNHRLQATFEELGIAQADLVQAGLLDNPILSIDVRFPNRSPSKTYLNFAAAENLLNVFLIPARKKIASAQLAQATASVSNEVFSLAFETESAFYAYQAAEQTVELRQTIADASAASLDLATRLREAGNTTELEYYGQRAEAGRSRVELAMAKADADEAREKLTALMGLDGSQTQWTVAGRLSDPPGDEALPSGLEAIAQRQRPDLAAARSEILAQSQTYHFTVDTRFVRGADLGADAERETDGQWRIGPSLAVPIPLFDQGQGAVARAAATFHQSEERYRALAVEIASQVRAGRAKMSNARMAVQLYHDEVLPTQHKYMQEAQLHYNGMFFSAFQLLQAKRDEIDAAAQYVQSLKAYWIGRAELERAIGGHLPYIENPHQGEQP